MSSRRDVLTTRAAVGLAGVYWRSGDVRSRVEDAGANTRRRRRDRHDRTDGHDDREPGGEPSGDPAAPAGPAVRWIRELGGSVRRRPTVHDGTLSLAGGENANAPPDDRDYLHPEAAENGHALDADTGEEA